MAAKERAATSPLIDDLLRTPRQYSFYQTTRLLQRTPAAGTESAAAPIGFDGPVEREAALLRPNPSMGFASADVHGIERIERPDEIQGGTRPLYRITVNFLGLYGAGSPLPAFYTEDLVMHDEETGARRDFFDLFHHRYLSFLYRSWEKYRYYLSYRVGATDRLSRWMRGLVGLGAPPAAPDGAAAPVEHPERLLSSIGLLLLHSRSAATLANILSHYFEGLPIRIEQFIRRDVAIEDSQRVRLGQANSTLGLDCAPGASVPDISGKFRLWAGPLDIAQFQGLLPDAAGYRELRRVVPFLLRDQLAYDIALILRGGEIPALELGADCPARLGWSSWLGEPPGGDATVVLET